MNHQSIRRRSNSGVLTGQWPRTCTKAGCGMDKGQGELPKGQIWIVLYLYSCVPNSYFPLFTHSTPKRTLQKSALTLRSRVTPTPVYVNYSVKKQNVLQAEIIELSEEVLDWRSSATTTTTYLSGYTWSTCHLSAWSLNVFDRLCRSCSVHELHLDSSDLRARNRAQGVKHMHWPNKTTTMSIVFPANVLAAIA